MRKPNTAPPPKRRKVEPVAEVTFDPDARQEYLTGYHKRKVQRANHAREIAQKKEREEKVKERRELRDSRKREAEERLEQVNAFIRAQVDSDDEGGGEQATTDKVEAEVWEGFADASAVNGEDEYVDEDKYTTVVVKELDDIRNYESNEEEEDADKKPENGDEAEAGDDHKIKKSWTKKRPLNDKSKKKKKRDFRYESKHERRTERKKQKLKSSAAAKARKGK
ncbi:Ribosomal RNA-processing protein 17-like protein [Elsinoe fawcettii]|nr:Ribosomal RNA-processing protein 17-like protein [Elsinoe fawcettii]